MKKVNALFLGLTILLAAACGKEDKPDDPAPDISNPAQPVCLLTQLYSQNSNGTRNNISENFYDSNRRLTRQNYYSNDYLLYEYDASGLTVTSKTFRKTDSTLTSYAVTEYHASGLLKKRTTYGKTGASTTIAETGSTFYDYNAGGELLKKSLYLPANKNHATWITNYTHLPNGVLKEEVYKNSNNNMVLDYTSIWTFDNKKAPATSEFYKNGFNKANNVIHNVDRFAGSTDSIVYNYSYQYNAEGYPTQLTAVVTGANGSANSYTQLYDHDCR